SDDGRGNRRRQRREHALADGGSAAGARRGGRAGSRCYVWAAAWTRGCDCVGACRQGYRARRPGRGPAGTRRRCRGVVFRRARHGRAGGRSEPALAAAPGGVRTRPVRGRGAPHIAGGPCQGPSRYRNGRQSSPSGGHSARSRVAARRAGRRRCRTDHVHVRLDGMPKGGVASHANVWAVITTVSDYLGIREDDRISGMLPISGVYETNQMLCSVLRGATLLVPLSPLMNDVAEELRAAGVTVLAAVPPLWMQLLQAPRFSGEPIPTLRLVQNAGGHLSPAAVQQLQQAQPQAEIFLQYGLTEVFRSTYLPP